MSLAAYKPIGFIPTADATSSRAFYEGLLGLRFESDDRFAMVFRVGPSDGLMLRITRAGDFKPQPFTVFGWEVDDLQTAVSELIGKGIIFERYAFLEQEASGIWRAPGGSSVAWFRDPDGNVLSLSQHPK